jgi:hypothetical protein
VEQHTHPEAMAQQSALDLEDPAEEYEADLGNPQKSKGESFVDLEGDL